MSNSRKLPRSACLPLYAPSGLRLDETDLKLLRLLHEGARDPIKTLADRVAVSHGVALNRLHRLEDSGVVLRYMADIELSIFDTWPYYCVLVALTQVGRAQRDRLESSIEADPEITEAAQLVGAFDLTLKVALQKPADWTALQTRLDPSADLILSANLFPVGRIIKRQSPHPLLSSQNN